MPGITFQTSTKQTQSKPLIATFTEQSFNYWRGGQLSLWNAVNLAS